MPDCCTGAFVDFLVVVSIFVTFVRWVGEVALVHAPDEPIGTIKHSLAISPFSKNHKKLLLSVFSVCRPLYFYLTFLRQCCLHISICFIVTKERKLDRIIHVSLFRLLLRIPGGILCLLVCDPGIQLKDPNSRRHQTHPGQTYLDNLFNICSPWTGDQVLASEH